MLMLMYHWRCFGSLAPLQRLNSSPAHATSFLPSSDSRYAATSMRGSGVASAVTPGMASSSEEAVELLLFAIAQPLGIFVVAKCLSACFGLVGWIIVFTRIADSDLIHDLNCLVGRDILCGGDGGHLVHEVELAKQHWTQGLDETFTEPKNDYDDRCCGQQYQATGAEYEQCLPGHLQVLPSVRRACPGP